MWLMMEVICKLWMMLGTTFCGGVKVFTSLKICEHLIIFQHVTMTTSGGINKTRKRGQTFLFHLQNTSTDKMLMCNIARRLISITVFCKTCFYLSCHSISSMFFHQMPHFHFLVLLNDLIKMPPFMDATSVPHTRAPQ